jgi:hypothetical protein
MSNHVGKGDNLPSTSLAGDVDGDKIIYTKKDTTVIQCYFEKVNKADEKKYSQ